MFVGGRYTEDWIKSYILSERRKLLTRISQLAVATNARYHMCFAGMFVEANPIDERCRRLNLRNSPQAAVEAVTSATSGKCTSVAPSYGTNIDLGDAVVCHPVADLTTAPSYQQIAKHEEQIKRVVSQHK